MKSALLLLALFVGVALAQNATQVCLPWKFQWQREQQFTVFANNGYGGFDLSEEWYDYTDKNFHYRTHIWENNGEEIMQDLYIIGAAKKLYTINATKGSGSVKCTVQAAGFPPSWPCLMSNATIAGSFYIAGDVFTQVYAEQITTSENITVYQDIALTAEDNVPINSREYYTGEAATFELYFNYALNLDADAFTIPSICPSGFETIGESHPSFMTEKDIRRKFRWLRNAPPTEQH